MSINIQESFKDYLRSQKREWSHNRLLTVGASESFSCIRRTYFTKHEYPYDDDYEDSVGAAARGSSMENDYVVPALRHTFKTITGTLAYAGEDQITLVDGRLSATPDGMFHSVSDRAILSAYDIQDIESDCFMIEIKSFDPRINLTEAKPVHIGQVHQQIGLIRSQTQYYPVYGIIIYVNASFVDDVRVFTVKYDPDVYVAAKLRAEKVYSANAPEQLTPEGKVAGGKDCKYCPYQEQCATASAESVPTNKLSGFKDGEEIELVSLVDTLQKSQQDEKIASNKVGETKEQIKQWMRDRKVGLSSLTDGRKIVYSKSDGRPTLDKVALASAGINLDDFMKVGKPFEVLKVLKG